MENSKKTPDDSFLSEYLQKWAKEYLAMGFEAYSQHYSKHSLEMNLSVSDQNLIKLGCEQYLNGKGESYENPFLGLGIKGFDIFIKFLFCRVSNKNIPRLNLEFQIQEHDVSLVNGLGWGKLYNKIISADEVRKEKEHKIIDDVKDKVRKFLYTAQNHSIGNGYCGWNIPPSSSYTALLHQFVRPLDAVERDFLNIACEELLKDGDIKVEKEGENKEEREPTRVTLTKDAIFKYFHP